MSLKVIEKYIPVGHPNRPGGKMVSIKARIFHGTANLAHGADDIANANYFARAYKVLDGNVYEADGTTPFRHGSAHVVIDTDSATICLPLTEPCVGAGDRPLPYTNGFKGQTAVAKNVFAYNQNRESIQIELAMNDMKNFQLVLDNAIEFCRVYCPQHYLVNYRHHDVTGKICPSPMVGSVAAEAMWTGFVTKLVKGIAPTPPKPAVPTLTVTYNNVVIDCKPDSSSGKTIGQLRPVVEALGKHIDWVRETNTVVITD